MILNQAWSLLLISLAAAFLPGASRWIGLPAVVMEIVFGVVLGKSGLNIHFGGTWVDFLAQLGFLLLMFQAGMEIDFNMLQRQSKGELWFQLLAFILTLALAWAAATVLGRGVYLALTLATTSLGLVLPTLKETRCIKTPMGQSVLIAATLADFLTLLGITFFVLYHQFGFSWRFLGPLPLFAGFGLLLKLGRQWVWWHPERAERLLSAGDAQELGVRLSLALLFFFVALSELVHLEPVLGAFLGGALLSLIFREKDQLENKLSGIGNGFLIPIFFIHVGMQFDLRNLVSLPQILFALQLLAAAVLVKLIPGLMLVFRGVRPAQAAAAGLLLSARLSLIIVAASIGVEYGFISEAYKDAIILLAVVSCLLFPSLFKILQRRQG